MDSPGQWLKLGSREPSPSHLEQPMVQPCENQKQDCPLSQMSVVDAECGGEWWRRMVVEALWCCGGGGRGQGEEEAV